MPHLRPYCARNAIFEALVRPAIGSPRCSSPRFVPVRTFSFTPRHHEKLSRKQRERSGVLTPEDQERIRKAKEKAERRAATSPVFASSGNRAQALLDGLKREGPLKANQEEDKGPPENEQIIAVDISLVDREDRYHKRIKLQDVLWNLNRAEEKLILVKSRDKNDPRSIPTCKIITHVDVMRRERQIKGRRALRELGEKLAKELEFTWTIGPADLTMKCGQMTRFLQEGRKLDITIARKYARQEPNKTPKELEALVGTIRGTALAVTGTKEYREPEGQLSRRLLLFFVGPRKEERGSMEETSDATTVASQ